MYIKPKKSLGQNFLIDKNIQKKIISAADFNKEDIVLEIGSGTGELASQIAQFVKYVYALEIDQRLYPSLEENLSHCINCEIIKTDILKFDIEKFLKKKKINQKIKVIGNIPYYISSPIIEHLINHRQVVSTAYLTVQKEFGRRVKSFPGSKEYGSFSCFVQYYAQSSIVFEIKKGSFKPVPKVDSCFLKLKFFDQPLVKVNSQVKFFKLIRTAFNQRRKTLRNSLKELVEKTKLENALNLYGLDINIRPEELSLQQFANLSNSLNPIS